MDNKTIKKLKDDHWDAVISRAIPSQVPFHCVKATYMRMLRHCMTQDVALRDLWACSKNGARVVARVTHRTVWNRDNTLNAAHIPVAYLYCSGCDPVPQIKGEDPIYADEIQTLSM